MPNLVTPKDVQECGLEMAPRGFDDEPLIPIEVAPDPEATPCNQLTGE